MSPKSNAAGETSDARVQRKDRGRVDDRVAAGQRAFDLRVGHVAGRDVDAIEHERTERGSKTLGSALQDANELAAEIPQISECHRITGEDCFYLKVYLRSIEELSTLLDRFLAYGETTTSIVNATPVAPRQPPLDHSG
jgi:DNA-binding Lrp family transcriptional regulator